MQAPLSDRLVGHGDAALGEEVLDLTEAQAETVVEPDRVADDLGRESVSEVAELSVGHVLSVAGLRQLDNAIETTVFTKLISRLMDGDQYRELQEHLIETPAIGNLIQGSGGLRKIRWKIAGRGKRGGVRVIYYWAVSADQIRMLYVYSKTDQEDLTKDQLKVLRQLVEKW